MPQRSPFSEKLLKEFSEEQLMEYHEAFCLFDQNRDGRISTDELGTVLRSLGQTPTQADVLKLLSDNDNDKTGYLEFYEFCHIMGVAEQKEPYSEEEILEAFKKFDQSFFISFSQNQISLLLTYSKIFSKDGDGYISLPELKIAMMKLGEKMTEEEVTAAFQFADLDGNGKLDIEEFAKYTFFFLTFSY